MSDVPAIAARRTRHLAWVGVALLASAGCSARPPLATGPPPIPPSGGPLTIDVVYPPDSSPITARDSNFVFGSVGHGSAKLTINGQPVVVQPNGAFLAWIPVPAGPLDSVAQYELVATLGGEEVRAVQTVRLASRSLLLPTDSARLDPGTLAPQGRWWAQPGELIPIRVRASPGAGVRLLLPDGESIRLQEAPAQVPEVAGTVAPDSDRADQPPDGAGVYRGELVVRSPLGRGRVVPDLSPLAEDSLVGPPLCAMPVAPDIEPSAEGEQEGRLPGEEGEAAALPDAKVPPDTLTDLPAVPEECAVVEIALPHDTLQVPLPFDLWVLGRAGPSVELREPEPPTDAGKDGLVVGRAAPGATTLWIWTEGVRARVSGRRGELLRLRLDSASEAWVAREEAVGLPGVTLPLRARVGSVRIEGAADRLTVRVSLRAARPYAVEIDGRRLSLTIYGAYADTDWLMYGPEDAFLRGTHWEQVASDRYVLHLALRAAPWGFRVHRDPTGLVLEVRKPPPVDPKQPLAGRKIALDPGHPPGGAVGPTRLYEADANLAIATRLKLLLERDGATVFMTRADRSPLPLYDRTTRAERVDAEILISVHNNALPDGVNPFENHGTSVYYYHAHSLDLARALQRGLLQNLGLPDLGIGRASLALARPTWMLAVLTEGAFMMIPEQEAALRDHAFLDSYARGLRDGLRDFLLQHAP